MRFVLLFVLVLFTSHASAENITLDWQDPNNSVDEVGGYRLHYWQDGWKTPVKVNVGRGTPCPTSVKDPSVVCYTLLGLEAGETYHFAVSVYDRNGRRELPSPDMQFSDEVPSA